MTRIPISKVALDVWAYILGYYTDNGYMPTLSEIATNFNRTSEWARLCLKELEKQGKIKITPRKHRGILLK
ncbi:hypothetical protein IH981_02125 [Patescibacteria group bacterium]|nr:hypothetical protein [Patescibacteria group bacterium]